MPQAFIAMPFAQEFYTVYKAIRSACEQLGVTTIRIDEVWARDDIYQQIEEEILKADFMIADFTGDRHFEVPNPNVVHEAAFARTHKKYILLMAQDHKCLPFDWRTRPAIIYQSCEEGLNYVKERLVIGIKVLMKKDDFGRAVQPLGQQFSGYTQQPMLQQPMQQPIYPHANPTMGQTPYPTGMPTAHSGLPQSAPTNIGAIHILENIIRTREGQELPSQALDLPDGFEQQENIIIGKTDHSEMVRCSTSGFSMGGDEDEDQGPVHEVALSDFLIDIHPVTNEQYSLFIEAGGYQHQQYWMEKGWQWRCRHNIQAPNYFEDSSLNGSTQPVVGVSWYEAMAYAVWAGKHLPTEAQWEFAARGHDQRSYPWGEETPSKELANFRGTPEKTTSVGKFSSGKSLIGCMDMSGNVWEWCYDWYDENYYRESPERNPAGPVQGEERVCRGGSWAYDVDTLKTFYRFYGSPSLRDQSFGFRCARIL